MGDVDANVIRSNEGARTWSAVQLLWVGDGGLLLPPRFGRTPVGFANTISLAGASLRPSPPSSSKPFASLSTSTHSIDMYSKSTVVWH
ncbi:unnamed protein product [Cuscuta campestris]|uniref:Uncharacterized protein n=1 Tax=Cuscuta campestris TaxID=132261 RepID=A0A484M587_9ASTE|nr:unnamed protein product [Cuscuta campestris]